MNNSNDDGGPAFPNVTGDYYDNNGMKLRDYFASAALQGVLMNYTTEKYGATNEMVARAAYRYADAMLEARKNGGAK